MVMDSPSTDFSNFMNGCNYGDAFLPSDESENLANAFIFKDAREDLKSTELPFLPHDPNLSFGALLSSGSSKVNSPDDSGFSDDVLKFINTILMEDNMEQNPSMFHDPLALQATEKSLYDVIGETYPVPPSQPPLYFNQNVESPDECFFGSSSQHNSNNNSSWGFSVDSQWIVDPEEYKRPVQGYSSTYPFGTSYGSKESFSHNGSGPMGSSMSSHLAVNIFSDSQPILQFNRGFEEASKFLPNNNNQFIDLERYALRPESKRGDPEVVVRVEDTRETSPNSSRGMKNHHCEDDNNVGEERNSKMSAVCVEESELSETFDKVLLIYPRGEWAYCVDDGAPSEATKATQQNGQPHGSKGGRGCGKKQGNNHKVVDLRMLLTNCAQSVAAYDCRTAYQQLKQIRQHSSPTGDASQRLAHVFANGLEARLAGTGSQIYAALESKGILAAEKVKAYHLYLSCCPYLKMSLFFANKMILDLARDSSKKKLHIIDFGIQNGFQWPMLIQHMLTMLGRPPKLRITGIEHPQPGFRPAEKVEETGRRLAKYCKRFNVQFQYHAIAQKWETIKIEDLNIYDDEVLAVNSLFRFDNLLDDPLMKDSPRDTVLKLIRKMTPDLFVQSVLNGSFNSPFFATRFRESLFLYSSVFDMFDTNIAPENQDRLNFEQEFCGREIMNIIACEGLERVERAETYGQWQVRNVRAGFKILPLEQELMKKLKGDVKANYHKDFVIDEDGQWMLQGWKGRIICASSCWAPTYSGGSKNFQERIHKYLQIL